MTTFTTFELVLVSLVFFNMLWNFWLLNQNQKLKNLASCNANKNASALRLVSNTQLISELKMRYDISFIMAIYKSKKENNRVVAKGVEVIVSNIPKHQIDYVLAKSQDICDNRLETRDSFAEW